MEFDMDDANLLMMILFVFAVIFATYATDAVRKMIKKRKERKFPNEKFKQAIDSNIFISKAAEEKRA